MDLAEIYAVGIFPSFTRTAAVAAAAAATAAARYASPNITARTCVFGE